MDVLRKQASQLREQVPQRQQSGTKLSEDCCRYGSENDSDTMIGKAVAIYGDVCKNVEKETEDLNRLLSLQVLEPLRAMITGGTLEDARHLAQQNRPLRCPKGKHEQENPPVPENVAKWQAVEAKMQELKANMEVLGNEASAALAAVEAQQQRLTFHRLVGYRREMKEES